jgi:hypothetical protein
MNDPEALDSAASKSSPETSNTTTFLQSTLCKNSPTSALIKTIDKSLDKV